MSFLTVFLHASNITLFIKVICHRKQTMSCDKLMCIIFAQGIILGLDCLSLVLTGIPPSAQI